MSNLKKNCQHYFFKKTLSKKYVNIEKKVFEQESAVIDKPAQCAASRRTCCKQIRWTISVINLQPN